MYLSNTVEQVQSVQSVIRNVGVMLGNNNNEQKIK